MPEVSCTAIAIQNSSEWLCSMCPFPQLRLVGVRTSYIYFLIFPGHLEFWTPLQIPIWGPHLAAPCYRLSMFCLFSHQWTRNKRFHVNVISKRAGMLFPAKIYWLYLFPWSAYFTRLKEVLVEQLRWLWNHTVLDSSIIWIISWLDVEI